MSTTINWAIEQLDVKPSENDLQNVVVTAYWRCTGEQVENDVTYYGTVYSTCGFSVPSESSFIEFDELTEEQILEWVWENGVDRESVESSIQSQIDSQINPPIIRTQVPWNK